MIPLTQENLVVASNQGDVYYQNGVYLKRFKDDGDYQAEKFFGTLLERQSVVPQVLGFDDNERVIALEDCGTPLEKVTDTYRYYDLVNKAVFSLDKLWEQDYDLPERYTRLGDDLSKFTGDFFSGAYIDLLGKLQFSITQIQQLIDRTQSFLTAFTKDENRISLTHFDLSPRNILVKNEDTIKIIDWSRGCRSYILVDLAIFLEKFSMYDLTSVPKSIIDVVNKYDINEDNLMTLSSNFTILRRAKKVKSPEDTQRLQEVVERYILSSTNRR